jgi:hypothetical protein
MKPIRLLALSLVTTLTASAQTNTYPFPASGNVGIGTTNPSDKLHVVGADWSGIILEHAATGGVGTLKWSPNGVYGPRFLMLSNETPTTAGSGQDGGIMFRVNHGPTSGHTDPAMVISQFGNVGIGTNNPAEKLTIAAPAGGTATGLRLERGAGGAYWNFNLDGNGLGFAYNTQAAGQEKLIIASSGNVGIGTTTPLRRLQVQGASGSSSMTIQEDSLFVGGNELGGAGGYSGIQVGGTPDGRYGNFIRTVKTGSYGSYWNTALTMSVTRTNTENAIDETVRITSDGNVGIGTTNPTHKLAVNGTIKAKEVIVETTGWSDYVLAKNYKLLPLSEVETHINANGHLPGIPSAAQVAEQGVSVGDMQARLLAKIEELTLHQIAQEKELAALRTEVRALRDNQR